MRESVFGGTLTLILVIFFFAPYICPESFEEGNRACAASGGLRYIEEG